MQIGDVVPIDIEGFGGEREGAVPTAMGRTMFFLLYALSFVLRHHHFVLLYGIGRAVVCILGGARKAMSQKFEEAVWARQGSHLKEVGAEGSQEQEPVRGFHARQDDVGRHEFRESADIRDVPAIGNCSLQSCALDHEGGARIVQEQCEAQAFYLRTLRCVQFPGTVHREERPDSKSEAFVHCPSGTREVHIDYSGHVA